MVLLLHDKGEALPTVTFSKHHASSSTQMWIIRRNHKSQISSEPHIKNSITRLSKILEVGISKLESQLGAESSFSERTCVSTEAVLPQESETIDAAKEKPSSDKNDNIKLRYFDKSVLVKVLVAASHAHLYLKLRHSTGAILPLIKYLGLAEGCFSSVCLNLYSKLENSDQTLAVLYLTEIQNTFHYLLHRLQELNIK